MLKTYKSYNKALKNINTLIIKQQPQPSGRSGCLKSPSLSVEISLARNNYIENLKATLKKDLLIPMVSHYWCKQGV